MRLVRFDRPHRLGKLAAELETAIPALRPVVGASGEGVACYALCGDGARGTVTVPDGVSDVAIAAVLAAHDPSAPSAAEQDEARRAAREQAIRADLAALLVKAEAGTITAAEQRGALARLIRLALRALD